VTLRPIAGIVLRQIYLLRGSPVRVFPMVTWVAIDIVLWGFITRYLNSVSGSGVNFVPTLLGGVLLWDFCTRIMQGVSTAFLEDVWSRNFLNLFASPLSISEYIAGLVITSVMTSCVGVVVMLVLATGVFHLQFFSLGAPLVAFLMVLFVFGITLGLRMAVVADAGIAVALRGGVLSALDSTAMDAVGGACLAAGVRLRGHAPSAERRWISGGLVDEWCGGGRDGTAAGCVFLWARVPSRRPHRAAGALQRRERGVAAGG
jgi:hypothetical protein